MRSGPLGLAARTHLLLWAAAPALLALAITSTGAVQDGWAYSLARSITFTVGFPFVVAAMGVARCLGPGWGAWILPLSIPLGLLPYLAVDLLVHRLARRHSQSRR